MRVRPGSLQSDARETGLKYAGPSGGQRWLTPDLQWALASLWQVKAADAQSLAL